MISLLEIAESCRHLRIESKRRLDTARVLKEMNLYIDMGVVTEEVFHHGKSFGWWRVLQKTDEEIAIINQVYNNEIPKMIDEYVKTVTIRRLSNVNK